MEEYSYLCGAYSAALRVLGISDISTGSVQISQKKPYLIELGSALNTNPVGIDDTFTLDKLHSAFRGDTRVPVRWACFLDATGKLASATESRVNKNGYYMHDKLDPCQPLMPQLERGYQDIAKIVSQNKADFTKFTDSLAQTPMRIMAISKAEMYEMQDRYIASRLSPASVDSAPILDSKFKLSDTQACPLIGYRESLGKQFAKGSLGILYTMRDSKQILDCEGIELSMSQNGSKIAELGKLIEPKTPELRCKTSHLTGPVPEGLVPKLSCLDLMMALNVKDLSGNAEDPGDVVVKEEGGSPRNKKLSVP